MLKGWKESKGVKAEIRVAKKLKMRIFYMEPDQILKQSITQFKQRVYAGDPCECGHNEVHHIPHCSHSFCKCKKFRGVS